MKTATTPLVVMFKRDPLRDAWNVDPRAQRAILEKLAPKRIATLLRQARADEWQHA